MPDSVPDTASAPRRPIDRRTLLTGLTAAAATGVGSAALAGPALAGRGRRHRAGLASEHTLLSLNHEVASFGTRLTGSEPQRHYVDWLAHKFERAGLRVHRDRLTFDHWKPERWSLTVAGRPVDVAFYFPYSGTTGPRGVSAPLVHLGASPVNAAAWAAAAGRIAVVEVATPAVPESAVFPATGQYDPRGTLPDAIAKNQPAVSDIAAAPLLSLAAQAGVLGVVCIRTGISDAAAADQYSPFTTGYQGCPALWLGPTAGEQVRTAALAGESATLTLHAPMTKRAATETIWAVLPGSHPHENMVLNTHTDGPNLLEENGGIGLLALARRFAAVPKARRRRSLVFVATTGHFQLPQFAIGSGQSASRWIADHPEWVHGRRSRTVAALTLEHLGCREWADDELHTTYRATGFKEVGYCFTTTPAMRSLYLDTCRGTTNDRTVTAQPVVYLGEGKDFYDQNIATASLIPGPTYLVAAPRNGAIDKFDPRYMRGQVRTFARMVTRLDSMSVAAIGTPHP